MVNQRLTQGVKVGTLGRQIERNCSYVWLAHTSIFGLCFMSVCLMKSNCYSLIYSSLNKLNQICKHAKIYRHQQCVTADSTYEIDTQKYVCVSSIYYHWFLLIDICSHDCGLRCTYSCKKNSKTILFINFSETVCGKNNAENIKA